MLGVMIFAIGVLALGRCVSNCIAAESARQETERARLALENRMAEVEAGEIATDKPLSDDLGDAFPGMTMKQSRVPVVAKTEKNVIITGLYEVDLEVDWQSENEPQARKISFYVLRRIAAGNFRISIFDFRLAPRGKRRSVSVAAFPRVARIADHAQPATPPIEIRRTRTRIIGENRKSSLRAFTLLEVMLAVMVMALIAISIYRFVVDDLQAIKISTDDTTRKGAVQALVAVLQEEFCNLPPEPAERLRRRSP